MYKFITATISALLAAVWSQIDAETQQVPQTHTFGMSPNAKSLQRYGDIPISLYTGTPDIAIPIATFHAGNLTLPITLSYHTGGIKADDHPGWVGLGWTLIAGGMITREVRDMPDETYKRGYMDFCKTLDLNHQNTVTMQNLFSSYATTSYYADMDTEPDKFNFSFPGCHGYFMLSAEGKWEVLCDKPVKVESASPITPNIKFPNGAFTHTKAEQIIPRFVITTDDGVRYTFGKDAIELSISSNNQLYENWIASAWHLTEIQHPNGETIKFSYERGDFIVNFSNNNIIITADNNSYVSFGGKGGQLISPVYLRSIKSEFLEATFDSSESTELDYPGSEYLDRSTVPLPDDDSFRAIYCPYNGGTMSEEVSWRRLDKISLHHSTSGQFMTISFDYSNSIKQRLELRGFETKGFGNKTSGKYSFHYYRLSNMPQYLSRLTDHWGYYNNSFSSTYNKNTNPETTGYGVLSEIRYPTGGRTILDFEPHHYEMVFNESNSIEESGYAGGVRIKRIINDPADGSTPEIRSFYYVNDYRPGKALTQCHGSGILEGKPVYTHDMPYIFAGSSFNIREESNFSLSSIINNCGNHIGYTTVCEVNGDGGYTIHDFLGPTFPGFIDEAPSISSDSQAYVPHSLKAQYRGRTLRRGRYNSSGSLIHSETFAYDIIGGVEKYIPSLYLSVVTVPHVNTSNNPLQYVKYSLYRNYVHPIAEMTHCETFNNPASLTSLPQIVWSHKKYNESKQVISDSIVTSIKGNTDEATTSYSYMWEHDSWYSDRHIKNLVSTKTRHHNGSFVETTKNDYFIFNNAFPVLGSVTALYRGDKLRKIYECGRSDAKGNPVQITDKDGLYTVYLWGKDRSLPVAEIRNADAGQVRKALGYDPEDAPADPDIQGSITRLRGTMKDAMVTSCTYIPCVGVTSVTDAAGKSSFYNYDGLSRLIGISDCRRQLIKSYGYATYSEK